MLSLMLFLLSEPLIWIWNDWQPAPCGVPDNSRVYPELAVGQKRRETPNYYQQILQDKCVPKAGFILSF